MLPQIVGKRQQEHSYRWNLDRNKTYGRGMAVCPVKGRRCMCCFVYTKNNNAFKLFKKGTTISTQQPPPPNSTSVLQLFVQS